MEITITDVTDRGNIVTTFIYKTWYTVRGSSNIWKSIYNKDYQLASEIIQAGTIDHITDTDIITMFGRVINSADELKTIVDSQEER
jgi:hypothetical protein